MKVEVNEQEMNKMDKEEFVEGVVRIRSRDLRNEVKEQMLEAMEGKKFFS